jgi:hypothetical protein
LCAVGIGCTLSTSNANQYGNPGDNGKIKEKEEIWQRLAQQRVGLLKGKAMNSATAILAVVAISADFRIQRMEAAGRL